MSAPIDLSPLERHSRIAMSWSGGKDSTAVLHMLRDHLHRIVVYTVDTGDLLPEMSEHIAMIAGMIPQHVRIETNVTGWIKENGLPSDLIPYTQHAAGQAMGEPGVKLASRYQCCGLNLMMPLWNRVKADGCTLLIRGTKAVDMNRLPMASGDHSDGIELFYPIQSWSHADVFAYLNEHGIPLPRLYQSMTNAPECARCSAWWQEGRGEYLAQHYPELAAAYQTRLRLVANEIGPSIAAMAGELSAGL